MMHIIDIPVKLCFRVGFDILLMIVFQGEKKSESVDYFACANTIE